MENKINKMPEEYIIDKTLVSYNNGSLSHKENEAFLFQLLYTKENFCDKYEKTFLDCLLKIKLNSHNNPFIFYASSNGWIQSVEYLLTQKAIDPSHGNNRTIDYACQHGHYDIVKALLKDNRVSTNITNYNVIQCAYHSKSYDICHLLLQDTETLAAMKLLSYDERRLINEAVQIYKIQEKIEEF